MNSYLLGLLSRSLRKEVSYQPHMSFTETVQSVSHDARLLSHTASMDVTSSSLVMSLKQEPVTRRDVIQKVLIIAGFVACLFVGVVVRLSTADLLVSPPVVGGENYTGGGL